MTETITKDRFSTMFGTFKPVGHLMVGMPATTQSHALTEALDQQGWPDGSLAAFAPGDSVAELQAMINDASGVTDLGYEVTLLRRYLALAHEDYQWLLIKVNDSDHARQAAHIASGHGATLAVYYRSLIIEELI